MLLLVSVFAALSLTAAQPAERITDWRDAVRCLAAFETAASKSFAAHVQDTSAGHDDQAVQYDDLAMSLIGSMGERFDFARMEQAETIRAREAQALEPLSLEQVRARADDCRARLPDPPAIP
ncbi:hypothetical protein [Brevundimonas sp.]|uniref:hypothetical protein n=1 Tax=Brevundimonas sp. TaxID=1871086 RepID=UPI0025B838D2|nr:hypothetical protein [Brevundimonas sp.]